MADGEALDLLHGSAFAGDQRIYSGDYARAADGDLFLITAGLRRKAKKVRWQPLQEKLGAVRAVKDPGEIRLIGRAARIAAAAR